MVIQHTLKDLLKALKGLVVMSLELETVLESLYNNTVPKAWAAKVITLQFYKGMHFMSVSMLVYSPIVKMYKTFPLSTNLVMIASAI